MWSLKSAVHYLNPDSFCSEQLGSLIWQWRIIVTAGTVTKNLVHDHAELDPHQNHIPALKYENVAC